jgi:transcription initiation factor IIE alpha subunit
MMDDKMMQLMMMMNPEMAPIIQMLMESPVAEEKPKRKRSTAYQRRYKANFRRIAKRYKLKSGKWKKGGFRSAVREAHRLSRKGKK